MASRAGRADGCRYTVHSERAAAHKGVAEAPGPALSWSQAVKTLAFTNGRAVAARGAAGGGPGGTSLAWLGRARYQPPPAAHGGTPACSPRSGLVPVSRRSATPARAPCPGRLRRSRSRIFGPSTAYAPWRAAHRTLQIDSAVLGPAQALAGSPGNRPRPHAPGPAPRYRSLHRAALLRRRSTDQEVPAHGEYRKPPRVRRDVPRRDRDPRPEASCCRRPRPAHGRRTALATVLGNLLGCCMHSSWPSPSASGPWCRVRRPCSPS